MLGADFASLPAGLHYTGFLGAVQTAFPFLLLYAGTFVFAPVIRKLVLDRANAKIASRNANRKSWLAALQDGRADAKLKRAREYQKRMTRVAKNIVFDTGASFTENAAKNTEEALADFDRRLKNT